MMTVHECHRIQIDSHSCTGQSNTIATSMHSSRMWNVRLLTICLLGDVHPSATQMDAPPIMQPRWLHPHPLDASPECTPSSDAPPDASSPGCTPPGCNPDRCTPLCV